MKNNHAIQEIHSILPSKIIDDMSTPLALIVESPYFSPNSKYQLVHWQKEDINRHFGNGVSSNSSYSWVVLPDGYTLTAAQIATIEAYAVNPT